MARRAGVEALRVVTTAALRHVTGRDALVARLSEVADCAVEVLSGEQEARIISTRLGSPPLGYANWTWRLLARKVVELGIVESVSYETVRRTLKKTG